MINESTTVHNSPAVIQRCCPGQHPVHHHHQQQPRMVPQSCSPLLHAGTWSRSNTAKVTSLSPTPSSTEHTHPEKYVDNLIILHQRLRKGHNQMRKKNPTRTTTTTPICSGNLQCQARRRHWTPPPEATVSRPFAYNDHLPSPYRNESRRWRADVIWKFDLPWCPLPPQWKRTDRAEKWKASKEHPPAIMAHRGPGFQESGKTSISKHSFKLKTGEGPGVI